MRAAVVPHAAVVMRAAVVPRAAVVMRAAAGFLTSTGFRLDGDVPRTLARRWPERGSAKSTPPGRTVLGSRA
jgi:hypothetical protein